MTQEEKQLLLIDLGARLHYGVNIKTSNGDGILCSIDYVPDGAYLGVSINGAVKEYFEYQYTKPYLRSLSSMTEEEKGEYIDIKKGECDGCVLTGKGDPNTEFMLVDFYNKHHLDYRGLIPMGLALEATKDMYKTE